MLRAERNAPWLVGGVALLTLLILGVCTDNETAQAQAPAALAAPAPAGKPGGQWKIEWEKLIKAAQAEGKVVTEGFRRGEWARVFDVFTKKYGIKVVMSAGSLEEARLMLERKAGRFTVDAVTAGGGTIRRVLVGQNLLEPVMAKFILPEVKDPSKWYQGRYWWTDGDRRCGCAMAFGADVSMGGGSPIFYNTRNVTQKDLDALNSMWDFLAPRWKGKIVTWAPPNAAGAWNRLWFHPEVGEVWVRRFMSETKPRFYTEERLMHDQLLSGAADILVVGSRGRGDLFKAIDAGAPVGVLDDLKFKTWKESGEMTLRGSDGFMGILKNAPNPNAARLLANWLYTKEGQTALHMHHQGVPTPTLREDVTEWGNTDPKARRIPGKKYLILNELPNFDEAAGEKALQALYDEHRFGK
jgi:ABC-type Fe3+ transport system substrate-binding protein